MWMSTPLITERKLSSNLSASTNFFLDITTQISMMHINRKKIKCIGLKLKWYKPPTHNREIGGSNPSKPTNLKNEKNI